MWLVVDFDFEGRKKREGGLSASKEIFSGRVRGPDLLQLKNQKQSLHEVEANSVDNTRYFSLEDSG